MPGKIFIDTNIWLYSLTQTVDGDKRHQQAADFLLSSTCPVINSQVIREICSNLIKKAHMPEQQLRVLIEAWYPSCEVIPANAAQHLSASQLRGSYLLSYWDSLIVAAALDAQCTTLYSEDMQHGQNVDGRLTLINPFVPL
jgi:predicted nucleic acid-binding protein